VAVTVAERLAIVNERIESACARAGRPRSSVALVAVAKTHAPERVREAYEAGQRIFGENYAQELRDKARAVADLRDARFRFIGHLQRNKIKYVIGARASIDTVDGEPLAIAISERAKNERARTEVLVEVNVGAEPQKAGCALDELPALVARLRALEGIDLVGLMAIPPESDDPERTRPHFAALKALAESLGLRECSMGMSHDYEVAIEEGATMVRVGTAIFGPRS
jgi:pyridoxal phosphate enzyme (YggS family)